MGTGEEDLVTSDKKAILSSRVDSVPEFPDVTEWYVYGIMVV